MRIRLGLSIGFVVGYYLGSMAGRERYEQLNRVIGRVKRSDTVDAATDKAKAAASDGYQKAKETVSDKLHHNGNGQPNAYSPT